jgi:hypothetical protein
MNPKKHESDEDYYNYVEDCRNGHAPKNMNDVEKRYAELRASMGKIEVPEVQLKRSYELEKDPKRSASVEAMGRRQKEVLKRARRGAGEQGRKGEREKGRV